MERSNWRQAAEHAKEALAALEAPSAVASASSLTARQAGPLAIYSLVSAHLALGLPVEASETRWDGQPMSNSNGSVPPFILAARLASAESGTTQWPEGAEEGERDIRAHQIDYVDEPDLGLAALSRERSAHALTQVRAVGQFPGWILGGTRRLIPCTSSLVLNKHDSCPRKKQSTG